MTTPASLTENLYEIPDCSICLLQLNQDLAVLTCGHCFHYACIMQAFQNKETCPFCQTKYTRKQIIVLHYQAVLKSEANQKKKSILQNLKLPQRNQIEFLLNHLKTQSQQLTTLRRLKGQFESQVEIQKKHIQNLKSLNDDHHYQIYRLQEEKQDFQDKKNDYQQVIKFCLARQKHLSSKVQDLKTKLADYQILKKYEKAMNSNEDLRKLKQQMQKNNIPPSVMAKQFYGLCQIAKHEANKNMHVLRDYEQQVQSYKQQAIKINKYNQKLEKQINRLLEHIQFGNKHEQQEHKQNEAQKHNNKGGEKSMNNKTKKNKAPRKKDDRIVFSQNQK